MISPEYIADLVTLDLNIFESDFENYTLSEAHCFRGKVETHLDLLEKFGGKHFADLCKKCRKIIEETYVD